MNKEIKIKTIGQLLDYVETEQKAKELIDYITNLQEENKHLETLLDRALKDYEIYRDRCDKAIEYSNNCLENLKDQESYICGSIDVVNLLKMIHNNYIEILKGDDNEQ